MSWTRPANSLVLEGLLSTVDASGRVNVAPMGPIVDAQEVSHDAIGLKSLILRPFVSSRTCANLKIIDQAVFHVTDDVLMMVQAAFAPVPWQTSPARCVEGVVLEGVCRYYELKVQAWDPASEQRPVVCCEVLNQKTVRPFVGFNRAKHAVVEAAILATRLHLTGAASVLEQLVPLNRVVQKTGSERECRAMQILTDYIDAWRCASGGNANCD